MDQTHMGYYYWQQPMANTYVDQVSENDSPLSSDYSMPAITKVSPRKQVLSGAMRITPENTLGTW